GTPRATHPAPRVLRDRKPPNCPYHVRDLAMHVFSNRLPLEEACRYQNQMQRDRVCREYARRVLSIETCQRSLDVRLGTGRRRIRTRFVFQWGGGPAPCGHRCWISAE